METTAKVNTTTPPKAVAQPATGGKALPGVSVPMQQPKEHEKTQILQMMGTSSAAQLTRFVASSSSLPNPNNNIHSHLVPEAATIPKDERLHTRFIPPIQAIKETQYRELTPYNPIQKKANNTGMPDNLKSGIENLGGYDMSDVKVHYNSAKPAQLQAHAYAQGTDIHIGPGQERYLPHEAWHVVQQKQGRVQPTVQLKAGTTANIESQLENEADVMGNNAVQIQLQPTKLQQLAQRMISQSSPLQFALITPTYTGTGGHSTAVDVKLNKNDTMSPGSDATADVTGFDKLRNLGLVAAGGNNNHTWIKFHVLNNIGGGSGKDPNNLTPASQTANHAKAWNSLEKNVKSYMEDAHNMDGVIQADTVAFNATVAYHPARTIYWKNVVNNVMETTDSSQYPNAIDAKLTVNWPAAGLNNKLYSANLGVADGLFQPEDNPHADWRAYTDNAMTTPA